MQDYRAITSDYDSLHLRAFRPAYAHLHSTINFVRSINSNEAVRVARKLRKIIGARRQTMQRANADKILPSAFLMLSDSARQQV